MNTLSLGRRSFVAALPIATAAAALPLSLFAASATADDHVTRTIADLVAAFLNETAAYRAGGQAGLPDDAADEATDRAVEACRAIERLPTAEATHHPDYLAVLALMHRRWLVMDGGYADPQDLGECLLVDAALAGHPFDRVPLLWHVNGLSRDCRPSEAELHAGWEA